VHKEEAYICDEAFFAGTAAEITPINSIDSKKIGGKGMGPVTKLLASNYYSIVHGDNKEFEEWLTYI